MNFSKSSVQSRSISPNQAIFHVKTKNGRDKNGRKSNNKNETSISMNNFDEINKSEDKNNEDPNYNFKKFELNIDKHADEKYNCGCNLCKMQAKRLANNNKFIHTFFDGFDFNTGSSVDEKDFIFVLKRLYAPKNIIRTPRLLIPETVGFINGEAKFIVITTKVSSFSMQYCNINIRIRL